MTFNTLHHIAIIASNYEVSKDFYVNKLGFSVLSEVYREERRDYILNLQCGDIVLELFVMENPPKRPSYPEALGLRHIAFKVDNVDDAIKELTSKGIVCQEKFFDKYLNCYAVFFKDPDELPIELHE